VLRDLGIRTDLARSDLFEWIGSLVGLFCPAFRGDLISGSEGEIGGNSRLMMTGVSGGCSMDSTGEGGVFCKLRSGGRVLHSSHLDLVKTAE